MLQTGYPITPNRLGRNFTTQAPNQIWLADLTYIPTSARYASGNLREDCFYPDQLAGHTERRYHPGE